jgi:predicted GTPase
MASIRGIGLVVPAMGYSRRQVQELRATIEAADCEVVVAGTPIGLQRVLGISCPVRQARSELGELDPAEERMARQRRDQRP